MPTRCRKPQPGGDATTATPSATPSVSIVEGSFEEDSGVPFDQLVDTERESVSIADAGVADDVPSPDGRRPRADRDAR